MNTTGLGKFAALLALGTSGGALAQAGDPLAGKFGARESVQQISLSPNGKQIAIVTPQALGGEGILVINLESSSKPVSIKGSNGGTEKLNWCRWANDTRLICSISYIVNDAGSLLSYSRLLAVSSDGSQIRVLTPRESVRASFMTQYGGSIVDLKSNVGPDNILMTRDFAPESSTGTILGAQRSGRGVISMNTITGKSQVVELPKPSALEYISDGRGQVRILGVQPFQESGYSASRISYSFRKQGEREWRPLNKLILGDTGTSSGFEPYAVDSDLNVVFGFDSHNGNSALYKQVLDDGTQPELVLSRAGVDVDNLIRIGRQNRVVGASYATERRQVEFFDPELRKLGAGLRKALPNDPQISFIDASADEKQLLLLAGGDTNPGTIYLYNKDTHQLGEVLPVRPELTGLTLSQVKPVNFVAADGSQIPAYLTLPPGSNGKNLPAIVMPHGGPSSRDEWGFDWLPQYFASRGYAVLQPNYRGSSGYGSAWFQKNGFQSWQTAIGDVNDAGRWLISQGITTPGKLAIVGWSYGGYAALQSSVLDPNLFKAIVAVAPVTDLDRLRSEFVNFSNYSQIDKFIGQGPHIKAGSPARNAEVFKAPVLMFHGDLDQNVGIGESRLMRDRLQAAGKQVELIEFPGFDHQLDGSGVRARLLSTTDAFLRKNLGL